jgi:hypothetical protein
MTTRFPHAASFGTLAGIAVMVLGLIVYLGNLPEQLNWLSYPVAIAVFSIGVKKWREQSGGYITFGGAYTHLILQTLVYSILITIWTYVFFTVIAPGMMEDRLLMQQVKLEEDGMSQEQIDMAMSMARKFTSPGMMTIFALIGNMIMFGIINLVVAAIVKKDPPPTPWTPPADVPFPNYPPQQ